MEEIVAIGQMIERAISDRKHQIIRAFQAALNPLAEEIVENDSLTEAMIYNTAYLIHWDEEETFSAQVEILDQQFDRRLKIRYNDFTAPYNFAQLNR
jgi:Gas vesicle synthesis protein GvpL/GvpF